MDGRSRVLFHRTMQVFLAQHTDKIEGTLSCFDRVIFRGYLPIHSGYDMVQFLRAHGVAPSGLKEFVVKQAERLKAHAKETARRAGRPFEYLGGAARKEEMAREIAERDGVKRGLVCVFSVLEPCRTFSIVWSRQRPYDIQRAKRKCLFLYYYVLDPQFGLVHVKVQTWFPFRIQVYVNGHEWLARKLDAAGIGYLKLDNAFVRIQDLERAQRFADRFASLDWVATLARWARSVNPLLSDLLDPMQYYWVTAQAEYATDVLFRSRQDLEELAPRLLEYSTRYLGARDVMTFLGRRLDGRFQGELVTDLKEYERRGRLLGRRVKHRMRGNWIKMYDKASRVLRVETVINEPEEFRVRRRVVRNGRRRTAWVPLRKSVAYLFRYREVSRQTNGRYLDALAHVADPTPAIRGLDAITTRKRTASGRTIKPFNPLSRPDRELFEALLRGEHALRGFANRDLRHALRHSSVLRGHDDKRHCAQVTRLLARLHTYRLIAKIPRSRRWRVSTVGYRLLGAALRLRDHAFPALHATIVQEQHVAVGAAAA